MLHQPELSDRMSVKHDWQVRVKKETLNWAKFFLNVGIKSVKDNLTLSQLQASLKHAMPALGTALEWTK